MGLGVGVGVGGGHTPRREPPGASVWPSGEWHLPGGLGGPLAPLPAAPWLFRCFLPGAPSALRQKSEMRREFPRKQTGSCLRGRPRTPRPPGGLSERTGSTPLLSGGPGSWF